MLPVLRLDRALVVAPVMGALLLALGAVPSAVADSRSFRDTATTAGPMDIRRVGVVNERRLTVRIHVENLQRRTGRAASAWIDTNPDRRGPEYFIGSGLWDSDWMIGRARNWRVVGAGPLNCPIDQRLDFRREVIEWTTGRACLGRYRAVRVSVETYWRGTTDYSPRRHGMHRRVARS